MKIEKRTSFYTEDGNVFPTQLLAEVYIQKVKERNERKKEEEEQRGVLRLEFNKVRNLEKSCHDELEEAYKEYDDYEDKREGYIANQCKKYINKLSSFDTKIKKLELAKEFINSSLKNAQKEASKKFSHSEESKKVRK